MGESDQAQISTSCCEISLCQKGSKQFYVTLKNAIQILTYNNKALGSNLFIHGEQI